MWEISLAFFGLMNVVEFGLGTALAKYVAEYTADGDVDAISATATIAGAAYVVIGVILTVPLYLEANHIADLFGSADAPHARVVRILQLVSLGLVPLLLLSWGVAIAVGMQRFDLSTLAALAQNGLTILVALVVALQGGSVEEVVISSLCVLVATAIASIIVGIRLLRGIGASPLVAGSHARRMLTYVFFTGATSAGSVLFGSVDRIVVGTVLGLRAVTYYTVTIGVANKLLVVADVAARPLLPASSAWFRRGRYDIVRRYLHRSTAATSLASFGAGTLLLAFSGPFLRWWMGGPFASHTLSAFRVLILVYVVVAIAAPAFHIANGIGHAWFAAATATLGGAVTILLIIVLARSHGLVGAALANAAYWINLALPVYVGLTLRSLKPVDALR
jgi:O-antigen/teichoic acid export membrane protein